MPVPHDATDAQALALRELVLCLTTVESTLSGLQAVRDALLATAARIADDIARAGAHPDRGELAHRSIAAEIATALRLSDRTVERRMAGASAVVQRFRAVLAAQGAGRISAAHAQVIVDAGAQISDEAARDAYAHEAVACAISETPGRLRPRARALAEEYHPVSIAERHRAARTTRRVWVTPLDDGMAELGAVLPATLALGIHDRLSQMAHAVKTTRQNASTQEAPTWNGSTRNGSTRDGSTHNGSTREGPTHDRSTREGSRQCGATKTPQEQMPTVAELTSEERSIDELRADLLSDLLLSGAPSAHTCADSALSAITARVSVTVPVQTLLTVEETSEFTCGTSSDSDTTSPEQFPQFGLFQPDDPGDLAMRRSIRARSRPRWSALAPADLDGRTPIDPETARLIAGGVAAWERVLTHPISGTLLAVDRYRPGEDLRRHLRVRDQRCRFPGCGLSPRRCDLDHTEDAARGGATSASNLATLCRRHHVMKHHTPWTVCQKSGGVLEWTSPLGHTYVDHPPPLPSVRFQVSSTP